MRDLQLPGNFLGDAGVAALAAAAAGLPGLRVLGLQENYNVGIEGARALGALLAGSSSLQVWGCFRRVGKYCIGGSSVTPAHKGVGGAMRSVCGALLSHALVLDMSRSQANGSQSGVSHSCCTAVCT